MTEPQKFDVFLCHNSQDKPEVKQIGQELMQRGYQPWLDEWELRPGLSWQEQLEKQIENIKSAAVFIGSSGFGPWQKQELNAFLREFANRRCPVIPVLLSSAPQQPNLPIFLRGNHWVDFRQQKGEPMGQLIWGVTGVRPEDQQKIIQPPTQEDDLSSDKGINYKPLRDLLKVQNWKAADEETLKVMLQAVGRQKEGWLDRDSIKNFPCTDLHTIDQLWVKHSESRFGLSVQKHIWESVGGDLGKFGDRVGWVKNPNFFGIGYKTYRYYKLTFHLSAPFGHLPVAGCGKGGEPGGDFWGGVFAPFFSRLETCQM